MGKSLQSVARLMEMSRILSSAKAHKPEQIHPRLPNRVATPPTAKSGAIKLQSQPQPSQLKMERFQRERSRIPLAHVVADCAKRWFKDTLKEAKAGDSNMQVLVGQMYNSGYGVPRDPKKGYAWISKASKTQSSVWKASEKTPGYRASDSDSNEMENKARIQSYSASCD